MSSAGRLAGKVAVVTGGTNGIGAATTRRFLAESASVIAADVDVAAGEELAAWAASERLAGRFRFVQCDVRNEAAVAAAMDASGIFGPLDCVFNNAAIAPRGAALDDTDLTSWQDIFEVNFFGVVYGIRHAARLMKDNPKGGSIINTASIAALSARSGTDAYSAAKAAIVNLTLSAAVRLAPYRIRVNAISPGPILTNMVIRLRGPADQLKRIMERSQPWPEHGRPEHVAGAALFPRERRRELRSRPQPDRRWRHDGSGSALWRPVRGDPGNARTRGCSRLSDQAQGLPGRRPDSG